MTKAAGSKSLKDQNRVPLWLAIAGNLALLYGFARFEEARAMGVTGVVAGASGILPMSLALIVTSVANALLSADAKARLVFLRRRHALPGHRAFSMYATTDPRIDVDALRRHLGKGWPADPDAENRVWYRFYKEIEKDSAILQLHREFLFTRDYATLAALFVPILGVAAIVLVRPPSLCGLYLGLLLVQFGLVRQAAATYGRRLVCTVLARKAAELGRQPGPKGRKQPKRPKPLSQHDVGEALDVDEHR